MACRWEKVKLGRTGLEVMPIGLGSSYGIAGKDLERAFERGVNYFYWGTYRTRGFGQGLRTLARKHRGQMVLAVQSYTRVASLLAPSVEWALRRLQTEYADISVLGWWTQPPPRPLVDQALKLRERGLIRHLVVSCHERTTFPVLAQDQAVGGLMVRYSAAHPGAESEVFPHLTEPRPGVIAYTTTRWGELVNPEKTPAGEPTPRASDCYRFALTHPSVDLCLSGPRNAGELDEGLQALDRGPMTAEEIAWMKRVGSAVRARAKTFAHGTPLALMDRVSRWYYRLGSKAEERT
jgi:aryl-alcohol dehydrogenase-like predicted oxidoreductase